MPAMQEVQSTCLAAVGYDPAVRELHVRFLESGESYAYFPVVERVFRELLQAESKGRYFNDEIKPRYAFRKLDP